MDTIVQYEQVSSLGSMDTSPSSLAVEIVPTFLSNASQDTLQPYILDHPKQEFPGGSALHMSTGSGMHISPFLDTPMDAVEEQSLLPSAGYVPVDPFSMLQSTDKVDLSPDAAALSISTQDPTSTMLSTASAFGGVAPPPIEGILDSNNAVGRRSRASTSLSPQSISSNFPSLSPPRQQPTPTLDYSSAASNSSADEDAQNPPRAVIGKMLKEYVWFI
jgi:hypothetical protein